MEISLVLLCVETALIFVELIILIFLKRHTTKLDEHVLKLEDHIEKLDEHTEEVSRIFKENTG